MNAPESRSLQITRGAAIAVAIGALVSPPFANLAATIMMIAFFFVPDWRARLRAFAASRLGKGVLVFAAALLLGTVIGAFNPQGIAGAALSLLGWRTLFVTAIAFAIFDSPRWKRYLAGSFVAFVAVAAIVALIAMKAGWQYREFSAGIVLRNTVTQAMAFAIGAFFAGVLLVVPPVPSLRQRVMLVAALLLLLGQLVFLQLGRSGQVLFAILVLVAVTLLLRGTRRVLAIAAVPVVAALALAVSPLMQQRFAKAWEEVQHAADSTEYSSMGIRVVMWQNSVELIRARPLLGYGLGGMKPAYEAYVKDRATGWKAIVTGDPHNQFLRAWIEGGLPGLLAFVFMLAAALMQPAAEPWRSVASSMLLAWCATSMLSSHFQTFNEGHLIAIFLGAFLAPVAATQTARQPEVSAAATAPATSS